MARILLVEDETRLAWLVERGLEEELHTVEVARDGNAGLSAALGGEFDLLVLDLMLPGRSGTEICMTVRKHGMATPILMLTARDTTADIVAGLDAGADDYLTKPFAFEELVARVRTLLRRAGRQATSRYEAGPIVVDVAEHRVWCRDTEVDLTAREFQILEALVRRRGSVLTRDALVRAAWERDMEPESNVVEVHVSALRRKLGADVIHTVRGVGYVLREVAPAVRESSQGSAD